LERVVEDQRIGVVEGPPVEQVILEGEDDSAPLSPAVRAARLEARPTSPIRLTPEEPGSNFHTPAYSLADAAAAETTDGKPVVGRELFGVPRSASVDDDCNDIEGLSGTPMGEEPFPPWSTESMKRSPGMDSEASARFSGSLGRGAWGAEDGTGEWGTGTLPDRPSITPKDSPTAESYESPRATPEDLFLPEALPSPDVPTPVETIPPTALRLIYMRS